MRHLDEVRHRAKKSLQRLFELAAFVSEVTQSFFGRLHTFVIILCKILALDTGQLVAKDDVPLLGDHLALRCLLGLLLPLAEFLHSLEIVDASEELDDWNGDKLTDLGTGAVCDTRRVLLDVEETDRLVRDLGHQWLGARPRPLDVLLHPLDECLCL